MKQIEGSDKTQRGCARVLSFLSLGRCVCAVHMATGRNGYGVFSDSDFHRGSECGLVIQRGRVGICDHHPAPSLVVALCAEASRVVDQSS